MDAEHSDSDNKSLERILSNKIKNHQFIDKIKPVFEQEKTYILDTYTTKEPRPYQNQDSLVKRKANNNKRFVVTDDDSGGDGNVDGKNIDNNSNTGNKNIIFKCFR